MPKRAGRGVTVLADGTVPTSITFSSPFGAVPCIVCSISNDFSVNSWQLSYSTTAETSLGFNVTVSGGPPGSTVTLSYIAYGRV